MSRCRLRTTTGCLRCRRRRKKCDEIRPICAYCQRWHLKCEWFDGALTEGKGLAIDSKSSHSADVVNVETRENSGRPVTGGLSAVVLSPFHDLPIRNSTRLRVAPDCLRRFFVSCTDQNSRYVAADVRSEIVRGWLESCFLDEAACAAHIAYWAKSTWQKTKSSTVAAIGLEFENLTTSCLRDKINSGAPVSEEMLSAAAVHFIAAAFDLPDAHQLQKIVRGIKIMVDALGGMNEVLQTMRLSTVLSVCTCDAFTSLLIAEPPSFLRLEKPSRPQSLSLIYSTRFGSLDLSRHLTVDVIEVFEELGFLLFFRDPSEQIRDMSGQESRYLFFLTLWADYRLGVLQNIHNNAATLSEIVLVALIILRQEVVADESIHLIFISKLLERLRGTIERYQSQSPQPFQTFSMWASLVALIGASLAPRRLWFADHFRTVLEVRHGLYEVWPPDWSRDLRVELGQLLWHERIAQRYTVLCAEIDTYHQPRETLLNSHTSTPGKKKDVVCVDKWTVGVETRKDNTAV